MRTHAQHFAIALAGIAFQTALASQVPLCPGLTIVTAINSIDGDYESIKTIESVTADRIRIKYSSEYPNNDMLDPDPSPVKKLVVHRTVLTRDQQSATMYQQIFTGKSDEVIPETTAIGLSSAILKALKTKGQSDFALSTVNGEVFLTGNREEIPNAYHYMLAIPLKRVGTTVVKLPVLVNEQRVELPTIQAAGEDVNGEKSEFFILDDEANPLMIKFRLGIGAVKPPDRDMRAACDEMKKNLANVSSDPQVIKGLAALGCDRTSDTDRDVLRVIKITSRCGGGVMQQGGGGGGGAGTGGGGGGGDSAGAAQLEQQLEKNRRADIYSIYFSFNSDTIREESGPTLKEIAEVMRKHPNWKLAVNGHTDGIASDQYNLALSQRRAAAVKNALVKLYKMDPNRFTTSGLGKSQPKDRNDTIEGRARNRRVELVRSD